MESIRRLLGGGTEPPKPAEPAIKPDSFAKAESLDPIQQAEQEQTKLKAAFEAKFGKPIADTQNEHAIAKADWERFEAVKAMDPETWSAHLDFAQSRLLRPESLTQEEIAGLKKMVVALEAAPPVYLTPRQAVILATLFMISDPTFSNYEPSSVEETESGARENLEQASNSERYEMALQQKLEQTTLQLKDHMRDPALRAESAALAEIENRLKNLREEKNERAILADKMQRDRATIGYQDRVKKIQDIMAETKAVAQQLKKYDISRKASSLETDQVALKDAMDLEAAKLQVFQIKFREALHDLETWDLNAKIARRGDDPYSSAASLETPAKLARNYQLVRHGASDIADAYKALFPKEVPDIYKLWESMSLETLTSLLSQAKDLARDYPLECADLAANLAHTYSILSMTGSISEEVKTILDRRTAENLVTDAILGQQSAFYSTGEFKEISLRQLALLDFCNRAPYIAGALMQEHMTGAKAAKAAAAWIPGLGNWTPIQYAAGVAGALAEVRAQKEVSQRISRQYEVMANSILAALNGYKNGGYTGAMKEAVAYAATRQMLQGAGDLFRSAVEGRSIDHLLTGWRVDPTTEALKASAAWGTGLYAASSALSGALLATGGPVTVGAVAWPVAVAAGVGVVGRLAVNAVHERFKSAETKLSEKQELNVRRLQSAYARLQTERSNLPALSEADFKQAAISEKPEAAMVQIATAKIEEKEALEYNALATKAHVDAKIIPGVLKRLAMGVRS